MEKTAEKTEIRFSGKRFVNDTDDRQERQVKMNKVFIVEDDADREECR